MACEVIGMKSVFTIYSSCLNWFVMFRITLIICDNSCSNQTMKQGCFACVL